MIPKFNWCFDDKLTANKFLAVDLIHWDASKWFDFKLNWNFKGDHCGPEFAVEIYSFYFCIKIYDNRHWSWEKDRFYLPGEEWAEWENREDNSTSCDFDGIIKL